MAAWLTTEWLRYSDASFIFYFFFFARSEALSAWVEGGTLTWLRPPVLWWDSRSPASPRSCPISSIHTWVCPLGAGQGAAIAAIHPGSVLELSSAPHWGGGYRESPSPADLYDISFFCIRVKDTHAHWRGGHIMPPTCFSQIT